MWWISRRFYRIRLLKINGTKTAAAAAAGGVGY
jgi:hypothetical protein